MDKTILCMFSGGLDSYGVLQALLEEKQHQSFHLHVHHMHLLTNQNRAPAENTAFNEAVSYYQAHARPFSFTTSVHDYRSVADHTSLPDIYFVALMAATVYRYDASIKYVAVGRTQSDMRAWNGEPARHTAWAHKIFRTALSDVRKEEKPEYIFPVISRTKSEIYRRLPAPIRNAFWSCRCPVYDADPDQPRPCLRCHACRALVREGVIDQQGKGTLP